MHITNNGLSNGKVEILRFSKIYLTEIEAQKTKGYTLKGATISYILWYKPEDKNGIVEKERLVVIPALEFIKT